LSRRGKAVWLSALPRTTTTGALSMPFGATLYAPHGGERPNSPFTHRVHRQSYRRRRLPDRSHEDHTTIAPQADAPTTRPKLTDLRCYGEIYIAAPMRTSRLCAHTARVAAPTAVQAGAAAHSYSVCRKRMSESGAWYRRIFVSGASNRASAFSFIARSAST